jgi:hypothetical protein
MHVVEHDDVRAGRDRGLDLLQALALDLDPHPCRRLFARTTYGERDVTVHRGEVIVLDENPRRQIHSMIEPTTRSHSVLLELSPSRCRLPRVDDAHLRALDCVHVSGGERRNAGKAPDEIERNAFRRENLTGMAGYEQHGMIGLDANPILDVDPDGNLGIHEPKRLQGERNPGDNALLSSHERPARTPVREHRRDGRDVLISAVLDECTMDHLLHDGSEKWEE